MVRGRQGRPPEGPRLAELPTPVADPEQVREVTREILARPEFQPAQPTIVDRVLQAISDLIGRVFEALAGSGQGSIVGTIVVLVFVAGLALLVVWFARRVRPEPTRNIAVDAAIGRTARDWLRDAETAEAAGRWREALRCRYRALLAELTGAGILEEVAGRTTGEYLSVVQRDLPAAAAPFADATRAFEVAWYGAGTTSASDVEGFANHARSVVAAATGRRVPVAAG